MTLGQKLKKARLDRGLTQAQVVGDRITRNMLSQLENDLASPSVGTLEYLASVLGVQAAWLLADEKEEEAAGTHRAAARVLPRRRLGRLPGACTGSAAGRRAGLLLRAGRGGSAPLHALEAERFAAEQQRWRGRRFGSWSEASLYGHAQGPAGMSLRVLALRGADRQGRRGGLRRLPRRLYTELQPALPYHLSIARYQLLQGICLPPSTGDLVDRPTCRRRSRAEYLILRSRLACKKAV